MDEHSRWSDTMLTRFREEFDQHREEEQQKWDEILTIVKDNAELSKKNASGISQIESKMQGILNAWETYLGGKKFFTALGKFGKWLAGLGIYVVIANWLAGHIKFGGN